METSSKAPQTFEFKPTTVLELFTSQGCSSCPPADEVLSTVGKKDDVVALAFHVDYWNYLGWEDPFAKSSFSQRQRAYCKKLKAQVYTPQIFINGVSETIGSRGVEVLGALNPIAKDGEIDLRVLEHDGNKLKIQYQLESKFTDSVLINFAITENELITDVRSGENRRRTLKNDFVVRAFTTRNERKGVVALSLPKNIDWSKSALVIYLQDANNLNVMAGLRVDPIKQLF